MTTVDISKGVALLDEKLPGWWSVEHEPAIDLDQLNMGSTRLCVCGQLEGPKRLDGREPFYITLSNLGVSRLDVCYYGFDDDDEQYHTLADTWRTLIQSRRDAARETTL